MAEEFNHFGDIANSLPGLLSKVVSKTAMDAQGNIQSQIIANGQVDTGNMLNSVHVEDGENATTKYVVVGAEYGIYQNYGTRFQPARPFFEPGIERTRPSFNAALAALGRKLGG